MYLWLDDRRLETKQASVVLNVDESDLISYQGQRMAVQARHIDDQDQLLFVELVDPTLADLKRDPLLVLTMEFDRRMLANQVAQYLLGFLGNLLSFCSLAPKEHQQDTHRKGFVIRMSPQAGPVQRGLSNISTWVAKAKEYDIDHL